MTNNKAGFPPVSDRTAVKLAADSASGTPHVAPVERPATPEAERSSSAAATAVHELGRAAGHRVAEGRMDAAGLDANADADGGKGHPTHAHCHSLAPSVTRLPCPCPHALPGGVPADTVSPGERYAELFVAVQRSDVFADSKTFPDCIPNEAPEIILARYRAQRDAAGFSLADFIRAHFSLATVPCNHYVSDPSSSLEDHIDGLWPVLTREPSEHPPFCSLLPLPHPYVVPGGRFGELYYWDSYFTMLGLAASGRHDLMRAMADNFAYLIETYGLVPNGTRTYYLSRSQPPVFALMTDLFEAHGIDEALAYLPHLRREHAFWMDGATHLQPGHAHRRVVRLADGTLLNRYWDDHAHPREEAFAEDTETARRSGRPAHIVFRDIRAAAESGWDFSSRWLDDGGVIGNRAASQNGTGNNNVVDALGSIRTTAILPIDLNALLWHAEVRISALCAASGDAPGAEHYGSLADARRKAIDTYLWQESAGAFVDYDWQRAAQRPRLSAATAMPMFVGLATAEQASRIAATIEARLLEPGGIATTEDDSGQQWDRPNGWAPLQWIAIQGLCRYGFTALADDIADRWLSTVSDLYTREYKLVEKYELQRAGNAVVGGDGGEYPLQDGFGWTNGVVGALLRHYASHPATSCRAGVPMDVAKPPAP